MDPFNLKASLRALAASKRQEPASFSEPKEEKDPIRKLGNKIQTDIVEEAPPGLLESAGNLGMSGLAVIGNAFDLPGSMVRDALTWLPGGPKPANPFDQILSPLSQENRTTGRDLLRGYGLAGKKDTWANFIPSMALEVGLDPLTYLTFGANAALTRGGLAAQKAGLLSRADKIATKLLKDKVGTREARHVVTPRMILDDMSPMERVAAEKNLRSFGMQDADLDKQLGGLLRINRPFSDKPFTWNKKPMTFGGLTDESGVVGAGKLRLPGSKQPPSGRLPQGPTPPPQGPTPPPQGPTPPPQGPSSGPPPAPLAPQPEPKLQPREPELLTPVDLPSPKPLDPAPSPKVEPPKDDLTKLPKDPEPVDAIPELAGVSPDIQKGVSEGIAILNGWSKVGRENPSSWHEMVNKNILTSNPEVGYKAAGKMLESGAIELPDYDGIVSGLSDAYLNAHRQADSSLTKESLAKPFSYTAPGLGKATLQEFNGTVVAIIDSNYAPLTESRRAQENFLKAIKEDIERAYDGKVPNGFAVVAKGAEYDKAIPRVFGDDQFVRKTDSLQDNDRNLYTVVSKAPAVVETKPVTVATTVPEVPAVKADTKPIEIPVSNPVIESTPNVQLGLGFDADTPTPSSSVKNANAPKGLAGFVPDAIKKAKDKNLAANKAMVQAAPVEATPQAAPGVASAVDQANAIDPAKEASDLLEKQNRKLLRNKAKEPYRDTGAEDIADGLLSKQPKESARALILVVGKPVGDVRSIVDDINSRAPGAIAEQANDVITKELEMIQVLKDRFPNASNAKIKKLLDGAEAQSRADRVLTKDETLELMKRRESFLVSLKEKPLSVVKGLKKKSASSEEWKSLFLSNLSKDEINNFELLKLLDGKPNLTKDEVFDYINDIASLGGRYEDVVTSSLKSVPELKEVDEAFIKEFNIKKLTPEEGYDLLHKTIMDKYGRTSETALDALEDLDRASRRASQPNFGFSKRKKDSDDQKLLSILEDFEGKQVNATKDSDGKVLSRFATQVDLRTLDGLPDQVKPIVGEMITKIGQKLFDDVTLQIGSEGRSGVAGDIDMSNGFINVYNAAIREGAVDKTIVHEFWHHLSKHISPNEVRAVRNEFEQAVDAFRKSEGNKPVPYELSSVDEFFAHKLTDLSMKYLGREKPVDLIGKVWAKALDTFEFIWDAIRQTLGYDQTKKIMSSFLKGHRSEISKFTDLTMNQRLMKDLKPDTRLMSSSAIGEDLNKTSGSILDSRVQSNPPLPSQSGPLPPDQIAQQYSEASSARVARALDKIQSTVGNSAVGRHMRALFDQTVLGTLTEQGQRIAPIAFKGYKDGVVKMRKDVAPNVPTWQSLSKLDENNIAKTELRPLRDYEAQYPDKLTAERMRMRDARKIRNERYNDLLRLSERPLLVAGPSGRPIYQAITEQDVLTSVPWLNSNQVINVTKMLNWGRRNNLSMFRRENTMGILKAFNNRYAARVRSPLPGVTDLPYNPNYGELLDPSHPHVRARRPELDGYDDGTSVINDISTDPEFSGVIAKRNIREMPTEPQIQKEIEDLARKMWYKYGDRLDSTQGAIGFNSISDRALKSRLVKLAGYMANLDPRHAENAIPLFSVDMIGATMQRLEHSHRSISHAKIISKLALDNLAHQSRFNNTPGTALNLTLQEGGYYNDIAVGRILKQLRQKNKDVVHDADKIIFKNTVQPEIDNLKAALNGFAQGQALPAGIKAQQFGNEVILYKDFVAPDEKLKLPKYDLGIVVPSSGSMPSSPQVRIIESVTSVPGQPPQVRVRNFNDPRNMLAKNYRSVMPEQIHLSQLVVPEDIANEIRRFIRPPSLGQEYRPFLRAYDKGLNIWKMLQTGTLPFLSFHTRNFGSGQASNLYQGMQADPRYAFNLADPTTYLNPIKSFARPIMDAHALVTGGTVKGAADMPAFKGKGLSDSEATELLRQDIFAMGIVGERQGLAAEQLQEAQESLRAQYPGIRGSESVNPFAWKWSPPEKGTTFSQRWLSPWMIKGGLADMDIFRPAQLGKDLAQYTEGLNRLAPYLAMKRQGLDSDAITKLVNEAQIDYTNLSNFERDVLRRIFPFYSYTRGITPFVAKTLAQRPGGLMGQTILATAKGGQSEEAGVTPEYIRETASIPLGRSEDGTRSYITGFGLPFEDPAQFATVARGDISSGLRELGSRMNPLAKSLIEMMTQRSLYQSSPLGGREIEDLDPTIARIGANIKDLITGSRTEQVQPIGGNPWIEYAIMNAGPGRFLNTIRTATDPRKYDVIPWKLLLNLGTGVRVADVSPGAQDAILRERLAKVMKDIGGRTFSTPYFPDYVKDQWDPQQLEAANQITNTLKLLNRRATERKKERQAAAS